MVIGTKLSLQNPNATFLTEPINVTINPDDEYHAFIMAYNTSPGTFIKIEFGSNDEQKLVIASGSGIKHLKHQIKTLELNESDVYGPRNVHVTLLTIIFNDVAYDDFLATGSTNMTSDNGNPLIGVRFKYQSNNSTMSYIELISRPPTSTSTIKILPTKTVSTQCPTSTVSNFPSISTSQRAVEIVCTQTSTPTNNTATSYRLDCYVIIISLSFSVYLLFYV